MKIKSIILAGIASLAFALPVAADQVIQDNLRVDGYINSRGGIVSASTQLLTGTPASTSIAKSSNSCNVPATISTDGTDTTPVATTFYYAQTLVSGNAVVTGVSVFNGTVASGNIKVGLARFDGTIIATSASTAMSGTDAYQAVAFTAPIIVSGPATYYILLFVDNTTARFNTHTLAGTCTTGTVTTQVYATGFTNFTPATTFTTAVGPIGSLY